MEMFPRHDDPQKFSFLYQNSRIFFIIIKYSGFSKWFTQRDFDVRSGFNILCSIRPSRLRQICTNAVHERTSCVFFIAISVSLLVLPSGIFVMSLWSDCFGIFLNLFLSSSSSFFLLSYDSPKALFTAPLFCNSFKTDWVIYCHSIFINKPMSVMIITSLKAKRGNIIIS